MKIAVNTRLLLPGRMEGIGWFTYETLRRITARYREHEFIFLFDRPFDPSFIFSENIKPVVVPPQARHPVLFYAWFEWSVPRVLARHKADLFLSPDAFLSLSTDIPSVEVIHDLNYEHYPDHVPFLIRHYYRFFSPRFARKATRIATVSEYSKKDIMNTYGIDADRIDVVFNGAGSRFTPVTEEMKSRIRARYTGGAPYFIYVGSLHKRKNIAGLLRAFDTFRKQSSQGVKLMITGQRLFHDREMEKALREMTFREDVIFTGAASGEELPRLIGSSLAMVYVSFFEGFGIPALEAMCCEVPVIASSVTSLPEVCGEAAVYADPFSTESIASAMQRVAGDEVWRSVLVEKGRVQRQKFSWEKSADALWQCMMKALPPNP